MSTTEALIDTHGSLIDNEQRFRLLVESIQDYAIFMLDRSGVIVTWNRGAEKLEGYRAEEIIGAHFSRLYPDAVVREGKCEHALREAVRVGRFEDEGWRVRKDGTRFWANVIITALFDANGEHVGFAKVTRDLTERRNAEEELRQSEQRFRLMIESVKEYAIYMVDPQGRVSTWNAGAERLKGYTQAEVLGKPCDLFYTPEDQQSGKAGQDFERALREGRMEEVGWRVRKDGTRFRASIVITTMHDRAGDHIGFAKVTRDLSEQDHAEQSRIALAKSLEANRIKDEFLATVSHELRTPLTAILGWATIWRNRSTTAEMRRAVETIRRNAMAQARLIDDMLDVSRIMTGKMRLDVRAMNLAQAARDAIEVVRPAAEAKYIHLEAHMDSHVSMVGDPERIQQIIWNLLSNAVKFTQPHGTITITISSIDAQLEIAVSDTGIGIPRAFLPHVFEPFRQADVTTTRRVGGLGLGLAIVKHITELHGGDVQVDSEGAGTGATFRVFLPHRLPLGERSRSTPTLATALRLDGIRVVIVDDDLDTREILQMMLAEEGAEVQAASTPEEARTLLPIARPHVILCDIAMPGEDGHGFVRKLRAAGDRVPVIALSAYARPEDRKRALETGFDTHLSKPIDREQLLRVVQSYARLHADA